MTKTLEIMPIRIYCFIKEKCMFWIFKVWIMFCSKKFPRNVPKKILGTFYCLGGSWMLVVDKVSYVRYFTDNTPMADPSRPPLTKISWCGANRVNLHLRNKISIYCTTQIKLIWSWPESYFIWTPHINVFMLKITYNTQQLPHNINLIAYWFNYRFQL